MLSPVRGEVIAINPDVVKNPDILNQDPYEKGWLLKVKVPKIKSDFSNLLSGNLVSAWMEENTQRLHELIGENLGSVYQDGGVIASGIARNISPEKWDEIASEFLLYE